MAPLSTSQRLADVGVRLLYLGGAIAMLWVLALRIGAIREAYAVSFEFPVGRWLLFVGAGVLVGALLGLAIRPTRWGGYRPGVALALGIPPALLLATAPAPLLWRWFPPSWVETITGPGGGQAALAIMVGLAIVAGLTSGTPDDL